MLIQEFLEQYAQEFVSCRPSDTAGTVAYLISKHQQGAIPVCRENGELIGIVSERDLVRKFDEMGGDMRELPVEGFMTRRVICCRPDQPMSEVRKLMFKHGFRHVPIIGKDYRILAVISVLEAARVRLDQKELETNVLRDSMIAARNR